jgi:SET domain-containing protein
MYLVPVSIKKSSIDGDGVFAESDISKGTIVWQYTNGHDKKMTKEEFDSLDDSTKEELQRIAYLSPTTNIWVMPPKDDPACYTNHDPKAFNTSVVVNNNISEEPIFVANRDIKQGEEITNNYLEFDENSLPEKFEWLKF